MEREYENPAQNIAAELIKVAIKDIRRKHESESITILNLWQMDAIKWLESNSEDNIFTFVSCCNILAVSPKDTRKMIKKKIKKGDNDNNE